MWLLCEDGDVQLMMLLVLINAATRNECNIA